MKKITLKGLAEILDMSISTVSRALSDHPNISAKTKARVKEVSQKYNYTPNLRARYLRTNSSGLIALILPGYEMFFTPTLMDGISKVVKEQGYSLLIFQAEDSFRKELDIINYCNQLSVDGILLSVGSGFDREINLPPISTPIVMLDRVLECDTISTVGIKGDILSHRAVEYLAKRGHRKIGGLFGNTQSTTAIKRSKGFKEAIQDHKPSLEGYELMIEHSDDFNIAMDDFLKTHPQITALYTMSDTLTLKAYHYLNSKQIRIPEDISIIAISDGTLPKVMYPNTTHFFHSAEKIGLLATELLIKNMKSTDPIIEHQRIECELIEMESVKSL